MYTSCKVFIMTNGLLPATYNSAAFSVHIYEPGEDFGKPATRQGYKFFLFDNENPLGIFELDCMSMCLCVIYRNSFLVYRNSFSTNVRTFFSSKRRKSKKKPKIKYFY